RPSPQVDRGRDSGAAEAALARASRGGRGTAAGARAWMARSSGRGADSGSGAGRNPGSSEIAAPAHAATYETRRPGAGGKRSSGTGADGAGAGSAADFAA